MHALSIALIAAILLVIPYPQDSTGVINGIVILEGSTIPQSSISVELIQVGRLSSDRQLSVTDNNGRFAFRNLAVGRYRLSAIGRDGVRTEYGQRSPRGGGLVIELVAGQKRENLQVVLPATATISGRVRDSNGNGAAGIEVNLLKPGVRAGESGIFLSQQVLTNDVGDYRIFDIPEGPYYLRAIATDIRFAASLSVLSPTAMSKVPSAPRFADRSGNFVYVPSYYPGARDFASAVPINLHPGENRNAVDFVLNSPVPAYHVRGTVINEVGKGAINSLTLSPGGPPSLLLGPSLNATLDRISGGFDIAGIVPGLYQLTATLFPETGRPSVDQPPSAACVPVDVVSSDVENIRVAIRSGFKVFGHVALDGGATLALSELAPQVRLEPDLEMPCPPNAVSSMPLVNGSVAFEDVAPGNYFVRVNAIQPKSAALPRRGYVKLALIDGMDALNSAVRIDGATDRLQVVVSTSVGMVSGRVVGDNLEAAVAAVVVLVPDGRGRQRGDLYRSTSTDASGLFQVQGVCPGEYKIFAWEYMEPDAWLDPDFLRRYESKGMSIHVSENSKQALQITLIHGLK